MVQIIMAIALLCGNPTAYRLGTDEVLACQKYYINCVKTGPAMSWELNLASCTLKKEQLGGPK